jgi:hypothetical protein
VTHILQGDLLAIEENSNQEKYPGQKYLIVREVRTMLAIQLTFAVKTGSPHLTALRHHPQQR